MAWTACAASLKIRCAASAEPMLTSMRPCRRAMSLSSTGSVSELPRRREQRASLGGLSAAPGVAGCGQRQRGSLGGECAQRCRAFVGGQRGDVGAAPLGAGPDELEGCDDLGVGPFGGGGAVPRLTVGVSETGEGVGQRPVHGASLLPGGGLVDRRAHQRMAHLHRLRLDDEEPGGRAVLESLLAQTESRGCPAQDGQVARVVGSRQEQHRLHRSRQHAGCGPGTPARPGWSGAAAPAAAWTLRAVPG